MAKIFNIETEGNISLILHRIKSSTEKSQFFRFESKPNKFFEGTIQGRKFKVRRITEYRKSYIPTISGEIKETPDGVNVKITMHENPLTRVFIFVWFLFLIFFLFIVIKYMTLSFLLIAVLIGLFILGIVVFSITSKGIKNEFEHSRRILEKVIKGEE